MNKKEKDSIEIELKDGLHEGVDVVAYANAPDVGEDLPEILHSERKHSWLSPSGFKPIMDGCFAKPFMEKHFPEKEAGEAAERGTRIHEIVECLFKGVELPGVVAEDELEIAEEYVLYCKAILNSVMPEDGPQLFVEQRYDIFPDLEISGTADCFVYLPSERTLHLIDLKTGRIPVDGKENWQLLAYMYGFFRKHFQDPATPLPEKLVFHIFQPMNAQEHWEIETRKFLNTYYPEMRNACETAYKVYIEQLSYIDFLRVNDGCKYCRARGACPAVKRELQESALVLFDEPAVSVPRVEDLSTEQKVKIFKAKKLLQSYLEAVEMSLFKQVETEGVEGLAIKAGKTVRKWADNEKYVAEVLMELGVEPYQQKLVTIGAAERQLKKLKSAIPDDCFERTQQASKLVSTDTSDLDLLED